MAGEVNEVKREAKPQYDTDLLMLISDVAIEYELLHQDGTIPEGVNPGQEHIKTMLKDRLPKVYEETGETVDDADISRAINNFLGEPYKFVEPQGGLNHWLAKRHVNRNYINNVYVKPGLLISAIVAVGAFSTWGVIEHLEAKAETAVEEAVVGFYDNFSKLEDRLSELKMSAKRLENDSDFPDMEQLLLHFSNAEAELSAAHPFIDEYILTGVEETVTRDNMEFVLDKTGKEDLRLEEIKTQLNAASSIINLEVNLNKTREGLENMLTVVRASNGPEKLIDRAETYYNNGMAAVGVRDIAEADKYLNGLKSLKKDIKDLSILPGQIENLYTTILATAKEDKAKDQAEAIYKEAQVYAENVDAKALRKLYDGLQKLSAKLNQEYTVTVINEEGKKSGIDRYYEDEDGKE